MASKIGSKECARATHSFSEGSLWRRPPRMARMSPNRFPKKEGCTNEFGKNNEEEGRYAAINGMAHTIVHVIDK